MNIQLDKIKVTHEDSRRKLTAIFNDDFVAKQIKLIEVKEPSILGNHYHPYSELFYILKGKATFRLKDIKTGESKTICLETGDRMILGQGIAHRVEMDAGTFTIEATEVPYVSLELNDWRYEIVD